MSTNETPHIRPSVAIGISGYTLGCRCTGCVEECRAYKRQYRAKHQTEKRVGKRAEQKRASDAKRRARNRVS